MHGQNDYLKKKLDFIVEDKTENGLTSAKNRGKKHERLMGGRFLGAYNSSIPVFRTVYEPYKHTIARVPLTQSDAFIGSGWAGVCAIRRCD